MRFVAAGLLGLLVPGAGHAFLGRWRAAAAFAIPFLALVGAVVILYVTSGAVGLLAFGVTPGVLPALAILNVIVAVWRLAAAFDATRGTVRPAATLGAVSAAAVVLVLAPHLWAGVTINATNDFIDSVFAPEVSSAASPAPDPTDPPPPIEWGDPPIPHDPFAFDTAAGSIGPTLAPTPRGPMGSGVGTLPGLGVAVPWTRPGTIPWGSDGRFDLLLLGSDAGIDRWSRRMDVMLLVEVDVASGKVAMIGVPRNLYGAPFPPGSPAAASVPCGCFNDLLNAMYVEATVQHPGLWPGSGAVKGIGAVRAMVSTLTGRPIDAVLVADLWGVIKVVDAMGGLSIDVPAPVYDSHYPDPVYGDIVLNIPAGPQHLDGRMALAYARSRHQDSDYSRMLRQQTLLLAIRDQIGPSSILAAPSLVAAATGFVWTDLPRESLPNLVDLFGRASRASVKQLRIVPPTYPAYLTTAAVAKIRSDIAALLGLPPPPPLTPSPQPSAESSASPSSGASSPSSGAPMTPPSRPPPTSEPPPSPGPLTSSEPP